MAIPNPTYTLSELLIERNSRLCIPKYQRAYTWDTREWKQFAEDLHEQATSTYAQSKNYYLGHFLFEPEVDGTIGLIDGQQRVTTTMLFAAAALTQLSKDETGWRLRVEKLLAYNELLRLEVVDHDRRVFEKLIGRAIRGEKRLVTDKATGAQTRMTRAVDYFTEWLRLQDQTLLPVLLRTLLSAQITTYTVASVEQAAQLFELQNDRGKDLTDIEKLKSYFIYQLYLRMPAGQVRRNIDIVHECFGTIYIAIHHIRGLTENELLRYYFYAQHGGYQADVLQIIKARVRSGELTTQGILDFSEQLSQAFSFVMRYQQQQHNEAIANILLLHSHQVVYPFLLRGYFQGLEREEEEEDLWDYITELSRVLEKLVFRIELIGSRARITDRLNHYLIHLPVDAQTLEQQLAQKIEGLEQWWYWRDELFEQGLQELSYPNRLAIYVLWQYELNLQRRGYKAPEVNLNELEHIAPQTENQSRAAGYGSYNEQTFNWHHRNLLGNLLLITRSHNAGLSNRPFAEKLASYSDTPLAQQREIARSFEEGESRRWNLAKIRERHTKLIEWAKLRWQFNS